MKGNRFATFEPCDKVMAAKVPRRQTHVQAEIARREKVRSEETANTTSVDLMSDSDSNTGDRVMMLQHLLPVLIQRLTHPLLVLMLISQLRLREVIITLYEWVRPLSSLMTS